MAEDAFAYAVKLLARRELSAHDLEERIRARFGEVPTDLVDRLSRSGYLDDHRFARMRVRTRKAWGRVRLAAELARSGVAPEIIREALGSEDWPSLEEAAAATIRVLKLAPPLSSRDAARAARALARLGYETEAIEHELENYA